MVSGQFRLSNMSGYWKVGVAVRLIHVVETLELNCSRINNLYPDQLILYQTVNDRDVECIALCSSENFVPYSECVLQE